MDHPYPINPRNLTTELLNIPSPVTLSPKHPRFPSPSSSTREDLSISGFPPFQGLPMDIMRSRSPSSPPPIVPNK